MLTLVQRLRDWEDYEPAKALVPEMLKDTNEAADRIAKLEAAIVGINIALARDEDLDAGAKLVIDVRKELQF